MKKIPHIFMIFLLIYSHIFLVKLHIQAQQCHYKPFSNPLDYSILIKYKICIVARTYIHTWQCPTNFFLLLLPTGQPKFWTGCPEFLAQFFIARDVFLHILQLHWNWIANQVTFDLLNVDIIHVLINMFWLWPWSVATVQVF